MATIRVSMSVRGERQFRRLARQMRAAGGGQLRESLNRNLRESSRPVLAQVRAAALAIPSQGVISRYPHDTRAQTAAATETRPSTGGVRFYVNLGKMPADRRPMPGLWEDSGGWYHPYYGRPPYFFQAGHPWFAETILRNEPTLREGVEEAMDEIADLLGM